MRKVSKGIVRIVGFGLLVLALAACGQGAGKPPAERKDNVVQVELNSFYVKPDVSTVHAGKVTFKATNKDVIEHEMLVVKVGDAPKGPAGQAVSMADQDAEVATLSALLDYDAATSRLVEDKINSLGEVADIGGGTSGETTLDLPPGTYLLLCNITAHFASGMRTLFVVTP